MSGTTRTGLVPTPKRHIKYVKKRKNFHADDMRMPLKFEALPMPLSLRPFGGLFNPFAKGCSLLCNHPAPTAVKEVIHQLKTTLAIEGRSAQQQQHQHQHAKEKPQQESLQPHEADNIPEDLFRRYAETDSRPMTPTPTVTSIHTRTSAGSFYRRCITPEWGKHENIQRKKIILDLRRTHSQETLYWKPSSDLTQSGIDEDKKPKSAGANEDKKPRRQQSNDQRPKSSLGTATLGPSCDQHDELEAKQPKTCINEHEMSDDDVRRGKKRKKLKLPQATTTFHLSEDPETQVATLGPDSLNASTRPSLIPNSISLLPKDKREAEPILLKGSFLTDEAFQALKTDLNVDVIENTFGRYLNRALREAIKYMPKVSQTPAVEAETDKTMESSSYSSKMPRKFSKSATRFDVPMDLTNLKTMRPWDYLSKHVFVSQQRKQLYKRVFLKYLNRIEEPEPENELGNDEVPLTEYKERTMAWTSLPHALEDVLEFHGTEENVKRTLSYLDYSVQSAGDLDFRTWCGIVSFAERLVLSDPECSDDDTCDELEKADFSSMEQIIAEFEVPEKLREIFKIIRITHKLRN
ncbi:CG13449 [Drosophila busckii]|uniref:CG13449 n=1 Tax=Drosophila busckii TaxID=30019 RepID=A0A0M4EIU9_DROBS|nr:CG13449 [Drosophila busckii]